MSSTPRAKSSSGISEDLVKMFTEKPVPEWAAILDNADLPHGYEQTFAAFISTAASLMLPYPVTHFVINKLAHALIS